MIKRFSELKLYDIFIHMNTKYVVTKMTDTTLLYQSDIMFHHNRFNNHETSRRNQWKIEYVGNLNDSK